MLAGDPERDLVFVPTGSAAPDYYGAMRLGDNRYANSIVALRASTGRVVWSFQTVHHDLWDYDNASPPTLVTLSGAGAPIPAVIQANKNGMLYVLNRETGAPVFRVEERPVPASDIPLEQASPTQPFTAVTPPLSPHRFTADDVWGVTEEDRAACRAAVAGLRNDGIFTPPSTRGSLVLPSNIGGAHWGGVAVDPVRQIAVVPVNRVAAMVQLFPREGFDLAATRSQEQRLGDDYEYNFMRGTPGSCGGACCSRRRMPMHAASVRPLVAIDRGMAAANGTCRSIDVTAVWRGSRGEGNRNRLGLGQPRRTDRHGRRLVSHRRGSRQPPSCLRRGDRARALAR